MLQNPYLAILAMMAVAAVFAGAFIGISFILKPQKPDLAHQSAYECGIVKTLDSAHERFSVKFFLVAMLFILFDIEGVFLFPWAVLFKEFVAAGQGLFFLAEGLAFVGILAIGLAYVWKRGALDWK